MATAEERFWSKVEKATDCWIWTGYVSAEGYGQFGFRGRVWVASRVAWTLTRGEIPEGLFVCHACDNPTCVNPNHLFLGTNADNMADMRAKGRRNSLTDAEVKQIRALLRTGVQQKDIAGRFNVSKTLITVIKKGYRYNGD